MPDTLPTCQPDAPADSFEALRSCPAGLTVRDVSRRLRVGEDKVRAWIARGELAAVNTAAALCQRSQLRIMPEALAAFERGRAAGPPPRPTRRRRRAALVDFYPD